MLDDFLQRIQLSNQSNVRPHITLSYAQSLDGSIAASDKTTLPLSNQQSLQLTHRLRAGHEAILIGIGTVLADDPQLTVRHAEGEDPQPVILDSYLRTPPGAKVFNHPKPPWIAISERTRDERTSSFEDRATLLRTREHSEGLLELSEVLEQLRTRGINAIMVEGGSKIISEFLRLQLVDALVITITPYLIGGLPGVRDLHGSTLENFPRIGEPRWEQLGEDRIVWGTPVWGKA